jgi:hypothetical protein
VGEYRRCPDCHYTLHTQLLTHIHPVGQLPLTPRGHIEASKGVRDNKRRARRGLFTYFMYHDRTTRFKAAVELVVIKLKWYRMSVT